MGASTFSLGDFLQPVPLCFYPTTWDELIVSLCESSSSESVVVGAASQALGIISWSRLLAYLGTRLQQVSPASFPTIETRALSIEDIPLLLEPIVTFQADTPLSVFLSQLIPDSLQHCGIVNREGEFLGLIDSVKLLQTLKCGQDNPLTRSISPPLRKTLDQFPLPLRIQAESDFILYRNPVWQAEVGGQDPQERILPWQETASAVGELLSNYPLIAAQVSCAQWLEHRSHQSTGVRENNGASGREEKRSQQGEKIWQFVKCPFQFNSASRMGWLTVAIDLTHSQQISQELMAKNQDLIQLNRLKDEFFASISHEIKSPVTTIVGLSSLLREHPEVNLNPRQQEYAELIFQNGRQLMALVNDLLDLTGLETGQMSLNYALVPVRTLCEQVLQILKDKYRDRALSLTKIPVDLASEVQFLRADELRLKQILIYLLDNALQSTIQGGELGLKVKQSGQWLTFMVWDTGIGIEETSQPFVFERIHPTTRTWVPAGDGRGLGLVLAKKLAQAHGGDISFWSKEGQGSQFTLILPMVSPPNVFASGEQKPAQGGEDWVLLVDAIAKTLEALSPLLTDLGYAVMIARTGIEAVEKARCLQPKFILLNPTLPLLSGWDVLTLLKSAEETRHITVILTEETSERPFVQTFSEDGLLPPPYTMASLKKVLQEQTEKVDPPALVTRSLTILHLFPASPHRQNFASVPQFPFDLTTISQLSYFNHRILEADDLDQAEMLTQVWDVDVVVLDGRGLNPARDYLLALSQCPRLSSLPLVILDLPTAEIANQVPGLTVFPCLLLESNPSLDQFWQVLQVATHLQGQESKS